MNDENDPLANLPGKPAIPQGEGLVVDSLSDDDNDDDDGKNTPAFERTTQTFPDQGTNQVNVGPTTDDAIENEVNEALAAGQGNAIRDADLIKKIEATVEFFLGKIPSHSATLVQALHTRRLEL